MGEPSSASPDAHSPRAVVLDDDQTGGDATTVTQAWTAEVHRRKNDLRSGVTQAVPWADAKARLSRL